MAIWAFFALRLVQSHLVDYPTPANLNRGWNWGSLAGFAYAWQLLPGVFVAMHFGVDSVVGFGGLPYRGVFGLVCALEHRRWKLASCA